MAEPGWSTLVVGTKSSMSFWKVLGTTTLLMKVRPRIMYEHISKSSKVEHGLVLRLTSVAAPRWVVSGERENININASGP